MHLLTHKATNKTIPRACSVSSVSALHPFTSKLTLKGGCRCNKIPVVGFHAHSQYQTAGRPPKPVPDPAPGLAVKGTGLWDSPVLTVLRGALSPKHFQPVHISEHLSFLQCKPTSDTHLASKQAIVSPRSPICGMQICKFSESQLSMEIQIIEVLITVACNTWAFSWVCC